jgi:nucleotide-binding universal stress UspA family protein
MHGIVVGVDGSPNSERALDWAMNEAGALHAPLTVVAVHEVMKGYWTGRPTPIDGDLPQLAELRRAVDEMIRKVASRTSSPAPASLDVHVVNGFAARELIDASQDADLLVVSSRGGGGFAKLAMGSVSSQVIQHAACPVVVIPHPR